MLEVWVKFQGYRIYGLRFDPPNQKNLIFESLWVNKTVFMHIWIAGSPIPIPFLPIAFYNGYRIYGLRIDPQTQKT